ncbi:hypothetical protein [Xanthobacter sp. KR7-225]|uniref:hypothetical protein n=1 Tax=Xanthobacter sp. KR7-225 TaxID=3156613 RepID=UPI0032B5A178
MKNEHKHRTKSAIDMTLNPDVKKTVKNKIEELKSNIPDIAFAIESGEWVIVVSIF